MKLKKFIRGAKKIAFASIVNPAEDDGDVLATEDRAATLRVAPLPELDESLQALVPVIAEVMEWTKTYAVGIVVDAVLLSYTKRGTRSMAIRFLKKLNNLNLQHRMTTPFFRIEGPEEGEEGKVETKHTELCHAAIMEADRYILDPVHGRSQQLLELDGAKPEGEGSEEDTEQGKLKIV